VRDLLIAPVAKDPGPDLWLHHDGHHSASDSLHGRTGNVTHRRDTSLHGASWQMDASHFDTTTAYAAETAAGLMTVILISLSNAAHGEGTVGKDRPLFADKRASLIPSARSRTQRVTLRRHATHCLYLRWTSESLQVVLKNGICLPTSAPRLCIHHDDVWLSEPTPVVCDWGGHHASRQYHPEVANAPAQLLRRVAYRVRRNNNTDTPLHPKTCGTNPPDGAMIATGIGPSAQRQTDR